MADFKKPSLGAEGNPGKIRLRLYSSDSSSDEVLYPGQPSIITGKTYGDDDDNPSQPAYLRVGPYTSDNSTTPYANSLRIVPEDSTIDSGMLRSNSVITSKIMDSNITTEKLANGSVTTDKLADDSVNRAKLGADLVKTKSATDNGIKVTLEQDSDQGLIIGLKSSSVTKADTIKLLSTKTGTHYLVTASTDSSDYQGLNVETSSDISVSGNTITASLNGNASSATKLKTPRNISVLLQGDNTSGANFDGSSSIQLGVSGILQIANGGTGTNGGTLTARQVLISGNSDGTNTSPTWRKLVVSDLPGGSSNTVLVGKGTSAPSYSSTIKLSSVTASTFNVSSDYRLKEDISPIDFDRDLSEIPVYQYSYKSDGTRSLGFIAQDLQKVFPELVREDSDGYLSIKESKLIYPLISEFKRLKTKVSVLEFLLRGRGVI